jgi:hypothetical protein
MFTLITYFTNRMAQKILKNKLNHKIQVPFMAQSCTITSQTSSSFPPYWPVISNYSEGQKQTLKITRYTYSLSICNRQTNYKIYHVNTDSRRHKSSVKGVSSTDQQNNTNNLLCFDNRHDW